ncbi:Uncharacterised protein [uncultured Ruminococcus sp.]|nr:Uncharacterised protein [uncultured Ruminococcus sp.]
MQNAVAIHRGGLAQQGDPAAGRAGFPCFQPAADQCGFLVNTEQVEDVVGWGKHHFGPLGQNHGLQHVDHLGDVCHFDAAAVLVEDIERCGGGNGIPHGILLVEKPGVSSRLHIVPGAPLVNEQRDVVRGVVSVHDLQVAGN